jgi:hypothetical protein
MYGAGNRVTGARVPSWRVLVTQLSRLVLAVCILLFDAVEKGGDRGYGRPCRGPDAVA